MLKKRGIVNLLTMHFLYDNDLLYELYQIKTSLAREARLVSYYWGKLRGYFLTTLVSSRIICIGLQEPHNS